VTLSSHEEQDINERITLSMTISVRKTPQAVSILSRSSIHALRLFLRGHVQKARKVGPLFLTSHHPANLSALTEPPPTPTYY